MEKLYSIKIFDGIYTWIYDIYDTNIENAKAKALRYHKAFDRTVIRLTAS